MKVQLRLFAVAKQRAGQPWIEVELPEGSNVGDLRRAVAAQVPELAEVVPGAMIAVDARYADDLDLLSEAMEIALIPPVSGGGFAEVSKVQNS